MAHRPSHAVRGLVIGKFMPPHHGHAYLIRFAASRVDHLTLIIFSKAADPIAGHMRAAWLRELYPDVEVLHVTDEHPVDYADPDVWALWINSIRAVYPAGPEIVFSSEQYGAELARRLGAGHVLVDAARETVPVCATNIRERPCAYWEFIAPCVRAYFVRRICLLGAESTGKTTLAAALAQHYRTCWVPEYARAYLETKGAPCERVDMILIARRQVAAEDELARRANRLLFCDTNLLATLVWNERYWDDWPAAITQLSEARSYDLYLLTANDIPWVADGLRDSPQQRAWMHARYQELLAERGLSYVVLSGTHQQRMAQATQALQPILDACGAANPAVPEHEERGSRIEDRG